MWIIERWIVLNNFKSRLKYLRSSHGLTQEKLADDMTIIYNYPIGKMAISQYENGKRSPSIELLTYLSGYFDCSVDYLIGLSEQRLVIDKTELALKSELISLVLKIINQSDISNLMQFKNIVKKFEQQYME